MTKKKLIMIICAVIGLLLLVSLACNAFFLVNARLDRIRNNAAITAEAQVINKILSSISQNGEVVITIPDGNGGNKSLILIAKGEIKDKRTDGGEINE